jgi:hypothetical protein
MFVVAITKHVGRDLRENSLNQHGTGRILGIPRLPLSRVRSRAVARNDRSKTARGSGRQEVECNLNDWQYVRLVQCPFPLSW